MALRELTNGNRKAVFALRVSPEQERLVVVSERTRSVLDLALPQ